jgi:hypothetical protein
LRQLGGMIGRQYQSNLAAKAIESTARAWVLNQMRADIRASVPPGQQRFVEQKPQIAAERLAREQANTNRIAAAKPAPQIAQVSNLPQYKPQQVTLLTWP